MSTEERLKIEDEPVEPVEEESVPEPQNDPELEANNDENEEKPKQNPADTIEPMSDTESDKGFVPIVSGQIKMPTNEPPPQEKEISKEEDKNEVSKSKCCYIA